jgi:hypothetical protein
MDSTFLGAFVTACSLFRLQLPFKFINFFEKNKDYFPGSDFALNQALFFFCCLNLAIALQSAMLWLFLSQ